MPKIEAIVNSVIPHEVEKPIPVRTISTRSGPTPKQAQTVPNGDQPSTIKSDLVADSTPAAESVKLSPQLSALARKEQAHRQREQALKEREKAVEAKLADAEKYASLKAKLAAKDYSELTELGADYNGYTDYLLAQQDGADPEASALKKLEAEVEALKKGKEDSAIEQYEETVAEYQKGIASLISSDPDTYSSIKARKCEGHVLQHILDSFEQDGVELSIEQAAKDIEEYLVEQAKEWSSLPKLKPQAEAAPAPKPVLPKPGLKTLTQQVSASSVKTPQKSLQYMSESERYAEARRRVEERKRQQG